nr:porin [uncultured Carboxylicivirga sp.]
MNKAICWKGIFLGLACIFSISVMQAQSKGDEKSIWLKPDMDKAFKPIVWIETWATYSSQEKDDDHDYVNRNDTQIRRFRAGAQGKPYWFLSYSFQLQLDRLGQDGYSSTKGAYGGIDIWNAFITAKVLRKSDLLNIHAGYFWAATSRQFNTSPWAVSGFDKTRACWYMRSFTTGKGNGIESGIGLGGFKNFDGFGINYRVGVYEPEAFECPENSSRLFTGRLMFTIGDPEQTKYNYMLPGNQWRKRKGITLAAGGSHQNEGCLNQSLYFEKTQSYGGDVCIDYIGFHLDGEYYKMRRTAEGYESFTGTEAHMCVSYNVIIANKYFEPSVTYDYYEGKGPKDLFKHIGEDATWDAGINWYLNKDRLKVSAHYIIQSGSVASRVGNYAGLALQFRL